MKSKSITALLTLFILTTPVFAQMSHLQIMQMGKYLKSNVDPKVVEEVARLTQCSSLTRFFDTKLTRDLLVRSYVKLVSNSEIDEKMAENYVISNGHFFTNMLIEKKYIDISNVENSQTKMATRNLYNKMCAGL